MSEINTPKKKQTSKRANISKIKASTPNKSSRFQSITELIGNISLSEIDTGSSTSGQRNVLLQTRDSTKESKSKEKKKKKSEERRNTIYVKEKRRKVKRKYAVEKAVSKSDTDTEWETQNLISKSSNNKTTEFSNDSRTSLSSDNKRIKLFDDPCTSSPSTLEKFRNIPNVSLSFDIPISPIQSNYRKNIILQSSEILPVKLIEKEVLNVEQIAKTVLDKDYIPTNKETLPKIREELDSSIEFLTENNTSRQDLGGGKRIRPYFRLKPYQNWSKYSNNIDDFYKSLPSLPNKPKLVIPPRKWKTISTVHKDETKNKIRTLYGPLIVYKNKDNTRTANNKYECIPQQECRVYNDICDILESDSDSDSEPDIYENNINFFFN